MQLVTDSGGCGHNLYSDDVKNGTWSGKNHMGKILAAVREELKKCNPSRVKRNKKCMKNLEESERRGCK